MLLFQTELKTNLKSSYIAQFMEYLGPTSLASSWLRKGREISIVQNIWFSFSFVHEAPLPGEKYKYLGHVFYLEE